MTDKSSAQILQELPHRSLFITNDDGRVPPTYRRTDLNDPILKNKLILMEIDLDEGGSGEPRAITWWPAGLVSKEVQRGIQMPVPLMMTEVRMLMALSRIDRVLITMAKEIQWDANWAELIES